MSTLKSLVKQETTYDIGVRVDDALDAAKRDLQMLDGKQVGFAEAAKAVEVLQVHVDKDVEEGKFDLAVAAHIKRYVSRAVQLCETMATQATNMRLAQAGKIQGFEHTLQLLKGLIDAEKSKVAALEAADPNATNPRERPVGLRPVSLKEQRNSEEPASPTPEEGPPAGEVSSASHA